MNSIKNTSATVFFAELLLSLRYANLRRGIAYLDRGPRRESYWGGIASRTGGVMRLPRSACGAANLLESLGEYWERQNEPSLRQLLPNLEALRRDLAGIARADEPGTQPLTEFVYPLF
jgi:hypothetical protein